MSNNRTELPKIEGVGALADAATLATGVLTLVNNGVDILDIKSSDIIHFKSDAFTAGVANVVTIDLNAVSLIANNSYSLTVKLPNVVSFFGGGLHATADSKETDAVYINRTYVVYTDATPLPLELAQLFADRMENDLHNSFSATAAAGIITITADNATAGSFIVDASNMAGTVIADSVAWVEPIGLPEDVQKYINANLVTAASYDRHVIKYRKYIRHQAVKGLSVVKEGHIIVFSDVADGLPAVLVPILDGTYLPVADYLGAPMV